MKEFPIITIAVFLSLFYVFPPLEAGIVTTGCVALAGAIGWGLRRKMQSRAPVPVPTPMEVRIPRPPRSAGSSKAPCHPDTRKKKEKKARPPRVVLIGAWKCLEYAFWTLIVAALLSAWQPGWFKALKDQVSVGFSGVAIEVGHEGEWQLTSIGGKGFSGRRTTSPLAPPSVFRGWDNRLIIVTAAPGGGYLKLEGECRPWPGGGPQILACNGPWARVSRPRDPVSPAGSQSGRVQDRESGTFSLEFYSGGREGQLSLDLGNGPGSVTGWMKFILVVGKS